MEWAGMGVLLLGYKTTGVAAYKLRVYSPLSLAHLEIAAVMADKESYEVGAGGHESPAYDHPRDIKDIVNNKGNAVGEAADVYGDIQTAEELGYVHRG